MEDRHPGDLGILIFGHRYYVPVPLVDDLLARAVNWKLKMKFIYRQISIILNKILII